MCVLSIKVPIRKKSGNLFNDPRNIDNSIPHYLFVNTVKWFQILLRISNNSMLPPRVRVDLGAIAMKEYSTFPRAPALLKPQHQIFSVISMTLVRGGGSSLLQMCSRCILQLLPIWLYLYRLQLIFNNCAKTVVIDYLINSFILFVYYFTLCLIFIDVRETETVLSSL